jgi:hypothetical protein
MFSSWYLKKEWWYFDETCLWYLVHKSFCQVRCSINSVHIWWACIVSDWLNVYRMMSSEGMVGFWWNLLAIVLTLLFSLGTCSNLLSLCPSVRPFVDFAFCRINRMLMKVACNTRDRVLCGALPRHWSSFFFVYSHTTNFSAIWRPSPFPVTGPMRLALMTFSTGPQFLRSYPKDPWFSLLNAVLLANDQSLPILINVLGLTQPGSYSKIKLVL